MPGLMDVTSMKTPARFCFFLLLSNSAPAFALDPEDVVRAALDQFQVNPTLKNAVNFQGACDAMAGVADDEPLNRLYQQISERLRLENFNNLREQRGLTVDQAIETAATAYSGYRSAILKHKVSLLPSNFKQMSEAECFRSDCLARFSFFGEKINDAVELCIEALE
jgi:hypothetical protein